MYRDWGNVVEGSVGGNDKFCKYIVKAIVPENVSVRISYFFPTSPNGVYLCFCIGIFSLLCRSLLLFIFSAFCSFCSYFARNARHVKRSPLVFWCPMPFNLSVLLYLSV